MIIDRYSTETNQRDKLISLVLLLALFPFNLVAAQMQSHDSILKAARQHILDRSSDYPTHPEVTTGRLDSRLRLTSCEQPLESYTPLGKRKMGKITVGIRCNGTVPWSLFVPVTVKVMTKVVVVKNNLPRGAIIGPKDITTELRDISRLHRGYMEDEKTIIGKKLRQRMRPNQVVTPSQLDKPHAIKRNNKVIILASSKTLQIRMTGKALQNGSIGELIRVRNVSSKKELTAEVIAPGIVEVAM